MHLWTVTSFFVKVVDAVEKAAVFLYEIHGKIFLFFCSVVRQLFGQESNDEWSDTFRIVEVDVVAAFDFAELEVGIGVDVDPKQPFGDLLGHVVRGVGRFDHQQRTLDTRSIGLDLPSFFEWY